MAHLNFNSHIIKSIIYKRRLTLDQGRHLFCHYCIFDLLLFHSIRAYVSLARCTYDRYTEIRLYLFKSPFYDNKATKKISRYTADETGYRIPSNLASCDNTADRYRYNRYIKGFVFFFYSTHQITLTRISNRAGNTMSSEPMSHFLPKRTSAGILHLWQR